MNIPEFQSRQSLLQSTFSLIFKKKERKEQNNYEFSLISVYLKLS